MRSNKSPSPSRRSGGASAWAESCRSPMLPVRSSAFRLAHATLHRTPTTLRSFSGTAHARGTMEAAIRSKVNRRRSASFRACFCSSCAVEEDEETA